MMRRYLIALLFPGALFLAAEDAEPKVDRTTPEAALGSYMAALERGDAQVVRSCFHPPADGFRMPDPPLTVRWEIRGSVVFGLEEVKRWREVGIRPQAQDGDVELTVWEQMEGKEFLFSYVLRPVADEWKIIAHSVHGMEH